MSFEATKWAWQQKLKASPKIILLSLAERANEKNMCFPSGKRLMDDTGLDRKTVLKYIQYLEEIELVLVTRRAGNNHQYLLNLGEFFSPTGPKNGTGVVPKTGQVNKNDQSQKRDRGSPKNGTGVVPNMGQGVSQKRDSEPNNNLSTNLSTNLKERSVVFLNLPETVSENLAKKYVDNLSSLSVQVTQKMFNRVMRELFHVKQFGFTPAEALEVAIKKNWIRFDSKWLKGQKKIKPDVHGGFEDKNYETVEPSWVPEVESES